MKAENQLQILQQQNDVLEQALAEQKEFTDTLVERIRALVGCVAPSENHIDLQKEIDRHTRELRLAKDEADAANRAKSEFLANMSHELRTPMQAVLSFAQLGEQKCEKASPDKLAYYFDCIYSSGTRLLVLLNDLLDLAKLEAGQMSMEKAKNDLRSVVTMIVRENDALVRDKKLTLKVQKPSFSTQAMLDSTRMAQVIQNLISNAIKFSPLRGEIKVNFNQTTLTVADKQVEALELSVQDAGMGIPEDELERIFDKFVQSSKTKTSAGGTGLGLAISAEIVKGHNGHIYAKNSATGGATFYVVLPIERT